MIIVQPWAPVPCCLPRVELLLPSCLKEGSLLSGSGLRAHWKLSPCTWVKPGRFGKLFVLCFLALGGHCLQMLCLPGFGTHANTQNLPTEQHSIKTTQSQDCPWISRNFVYMCLTSQNTRPQPTPKQLFWPMPSPGQSPQKPMLSVSLSLSFSKEICWKEARSNTEQSLMFRSLLDQRLRVAKRDWLEDQERKDSVWISSVVLQNGQSLMGTIRQLLWLLRDGRMAGGYFPSSVAGKLSCSRGQKLNTNSFFPNFSGTTKKFGFPGFEGHTELLGPHPFTWKTPTPTGRYLDPKVWVCAPFSCLIFAGLQKGPIPERRKPSLSTRCSSGERGGSKSLPS